MWRWLAIAWDWLQSGGRERLYRFVAALLDWIRPTRITAEQWLKKSIAINAALDRGCKALGASSALLLESENGTKMERPAQVMLVTVTNEAVIGIAPCQRQFVGTPVDQGYLRILARLVDHGEAVVEVDTMEDGVLKDLYLSRGVKTAVMQRLQSRRSVIRYLSVRFADAREISAAERTAVRDLAMEIAAIIDDPAGD